MPINDTAISFEEFYKDAMHLKDQKNFRGILDTLYTLKAKENRRVKEAIHTFIEFLEAEQTKPMEARAGRDRYDEEFYKYANAIMPALFLRSLMIIRGLQMNMVGLKRKVANIKKNLINGSNFVEHAMRISEERLQRSLENLKTTFNGMKNMSENNSELMNTIKKYETWLMCEIAKPIDEMLSKPELKLRYQQFYCHISKYLSKHYLGLFGKTKHKLLLYFYSRNLNKIS